MLFEYILVLSVLVMVIHLGGQVDLSFMEEAARKYWEKEKNNLKIRYFTNIKNLKGHRKNGGGGGENLGLVGKGATGHQSGLVVPSQP